MSKENKNDIPEIDMSELDRAMESDEISEDIRTEPDEILKQEIRKEMDQISKEDSAKESEETSKEKTGTEPEGASNQERIEESDSTKGEDTPPESADKETLPNRAGNENENINQELTGKSDKKSKEDLTKEGKNPQKRKKKILIITLSIIGGILLLAVAAAIILPNYLLNQIQYETIDDIDLAKSDLSEEELANAVKVPKLVNDSNIINLLLIGEEAITTDENGGTVIESKTRGRSDANIVVTINRKKKTVKMISFLRDTYVQIPGYQNNKLNQAYQYGGGPLLKDVLQLNFNVITDGYIRAKFSDFRDVIDALGGVNIKLTESEAQCLNTTNYISEKKYRNVKPGMNRLNGVQALGYCRIRRGKNYEAVTSLGGHNNDWGRTERQKNVLNAIFEEYKTKSYTELLPFANKVLPKLTTNMTKNELIAILSVVVGMDLDKLETLTVPTENEYTSVAGSALQVNFVSMNAKIYDFIHGNEPEETSSVSD